jgi:hypothetical protein
MRDGILSTPMHLEDLRRLIALLISAAEIGAVGKKSDAIKSEAIID